jgi:hypothetical protein
MKEPIPIAPIPGADARELHRLIAEAKTAAEKLTDLAATARIIPEPRIHIWALCERANELFNRLEAAEAEAQQFSHRIKVRPN